MKRVFLSRKVLENAGLTDEGFLVYVALRTKWYYSKLNFNKDIIHLQDLMWLLSDALECSNRYIMKMRQGIENLVSLKYIEVQKINSNAVIATFNDTYFFSTKKNEPDFEPYAVVYEYEIHTIMGSGEKFRDKLLRYFTAKIATIYNGENKRMSVEKDGYSLMNNIGCMPIGYCASLAGIGVKAAIAYDKWIEEHNLLVILRSSNKIIDEKTMGIVNGFPNCYARPEHILTLKAYYDQREDNISNTNILKISNEANIRRSRKQTYNAYKNGLRYNKMKLVLAISERIDNCISVLKSLRKQGKAGSEEAYATEQEIEDFYLQMSEICWSGFLNGDIELKSFA